MEPQIYISEIKTLLVTSQIVASIAIVEEWALPDQGYFRARLTLKNDDFLEVAEYFTVDKDRCVPQSYRFQWMDAARQNMKRRWDNVEHHPELPNFPDHVHIGESGTVEPGESMSIIQLISMLEQMLTE